MTPPPPQGTVTPLSTAFPAEEAIKATQRVHATLSSRRVQLDQLNHFISENSQLINLIHRLPDELHHPIMVPFGSAAFFPGKIIHTNELMVLLGEGYYAERTAKQTVDILKRRGKGLEMQVEGVKAVMDDLKAEASFFNATAAEAAEGLVEIREDYVEETSPAEQSVASVPKSDSVYPKTDKTSGADDEDEYNRILARLAELEKEEEEAEKEDEEAENSSESEEDEEINEGSQLSSSQHTIAEGGKSSELRAEVSQKHHVPKDESANDQVLAVKSLNSMETSLKTPAVKERLHSTQKEEIPKLSTHTLTSSSKTIIGSIVERPHNLQTNPIEQPPGGRSTRPVSRFKQQRK